MTGSHTIEVKSKRIDFKITVNRNITIIRGDSAIGKTWFVDLLDEYILDPKGGVNISCDAKVRVLTYGMWIDSWTPQPNTIYILDEDSTFMQTKEFAEKIKNADSYFILITRHNLSTLPFSITEIYTFHTSGRVVRFKREYLPCEDICSIAYSKSDKFSKPDLIIVEDSNSGYQFYKKYTSIPVVSANGKSNIFNELLKYRYKNIIVIVDGAAFGPEMNEISNASSTTNNVIILAPESFEWLILKSGILSSYIVNNKDILEHTENYADSIRYFSWEQFFTDLLILSTRNNIFSYNKSKINEIYLSDQHMQKIGSKLCTDLVPFYKYDYDTNNFSRKDTLTSYFK